MVMQAMRKNLKVIIWVAIIGFLATVVFSWGMNYTSGGGCENEPMVLVVNGEEVPAYEYDQLFRAIFNQEVEQAKSQYGPLYHPVINQQIAEDVSAEVLEMLVQEYVVRQRAAEWGLTVTDGEIDDVIRATPYFQDETGVFNPEIYLAQLDEFGTTDDEYRDSLRRDLLVRKVYSIITDAVFAPEPYARMEFVETRQTATADIVVVPGGDFQQLVQLDEGEARAYYEEHRDEFPAPARVDVDYIALVFNDLYEMISFEEELLCDLYERRKEDYLRARHILFTPADDSPEALDEAYARAEEALDRLEDGEDFAELAGELSEDASAAEGGDLGFFRRNADPTLEGPAGRKMVDEFEIAAFALDLDTYTTEPVQTQFGYHLIYREPDEIPFEDIKSALEHELRMDQTLEAIDGYVEEIQKSLDRGESLEEIAQRLGSLGIEVQSVEDLAEDAVIVNEKIGSFLGFRAAAFALEEPGELSGIITRDYSMPGEETQSLRRDYYVLRLVEHQPSEPYPFEEVQGRVESQLVRERAAEMAAVAAAELHEAADETDLETACAAAGFEIINVPGVTRSGSLPGIGSATKPARWAFELNPGELSPVIEQGESYYLVRGVSIDEPSPIDYGAALEDTRLSLSYALRNPFFEAWVGELVAEAEVRNLLPELIAKAEQRRLEELQRQMEEEEDAG